MIKNCFLPFSILFFTLTCTNITPEKNNGIDEIKIGDQVWSNNIAIPLRGSICPENCEKNGRLYTLEAAKQIANTLQGWHLPTENDWEILEEFVKDPELKDLGSFKSGAEKLKKIKGFDIFMGFKSGNQEIVNAGVWGCYWVDKLDQGNEGEKIGKIKILKTEGNRSNMIYSPAVVFDQNHYVSVKLVKD